MKLLHETDDASNKKKLIKSQVEKRRRERMNRSLEHLRTMLLQEPQQGEVQHRVEKAEVLEHTVLFLQKKAKERKTKGPRSSFQDGFSSCLQRASQFLGPKGKGLWIGPALDATFAGRFTGSHNDSAATQSRTHTQSILQMLRQRSKSGGGAHSYRLPAQPGVPRQPQTHSGLETRAERPETKESSSQSPPLIQTLWRPWP
ncbi:hairy and enhancer of split related-7 [Kryptolebias marmoratus]|uniref:Transcription factor HES-5-like n=1 Tax=Kryptolebias marmoratus TaxID=37003 RepID=A0A3Q3G772_KRYMA|nr:hairy and enhancer of split related-7 [Kryptolebias marmoratus]